VQYQIFLRYKEEITEKHFLGLVFGIIVRSKKRIQSTFVHGMFHAKTNKSIKASFKKHVLIGEVQYLVLKNYVST